MVCYRDPSLQRLRRLQSPRKRRNTAARDTADQLLVTIDQNSHNDLANHDGFRQSSSPRGEHLKHLITMMLWLHALRI